MRITNFYNICKGIVLQYVDIFEAHFLSYAITVLLVVYTACTVFVVAHDSVRTQNILYVKNSNNHLVAKHDDRVVQETKNASSVEKTHILASKNGTRYYYTWCVASQIKPENIVYFKDETDALAAGLTKSSRC